jgi:hypothetical protein
MATYTLDALLDAIEGIMDDAASLVRSQTYDELTEGIHDYPLLQVYPEENTGTDWTGETDRVTLSGKHSIKEYTVHGDIYARQRSNIAEDMKKCVDVANEMENILDNLSYPLFGLACVTSGSPPRVWGKRYHQRRGGWGPAVHPHACGENGADGLDRFRGVRFTPTRVGKTRSQRP